MSANLYGIAAVTPMLFVACLIWLEVIEKKSAVPTHIRKFDCRCMGPYDGTLSISIKCWVLGILATFYKIGKDEEAWAIILDWLYSCDDPDKIVYDSAQDSREKFLAELINAEHLKQEPKFNISSMFDYKALPKTMRFNDRLVFNDVFTALDSLQNAERKEVEDGK